MSCTRNAQQSRVQPQVTSPGAPPKLGEVLGRDLRRGRRALAQEADAGGAGHAVRVLRGTVLEAAKVAQDARRRVSCSWQGIHVRVPRAAGEGRDSRSRPGTCRPSRRCESLGSLQPDSSNEPTRLLGRRRPRLTRDSGRSRRFQRPREEQTGSGGRSGPLLRAAASGAAQLTLTWMLFGFASGFFGRWMWSTPCFDSARIFSESMVAGIEKARVNVP